MDWWQSHLGAGCTFEVVAEETNLSKDKCEFLTTKSGWIVSPRF
jgi:hypothetical protein